MHYQIHDRTTSVDLHLKCWFAAGTAQSCFETGRHGIRVAQITRQLLHHIVKSGDTALGSPHGACMHAILPLAISPHAPLSPIRTPPMRIPLGQFKSMCRRPCGAVMSSYPMGAWCCPWGPAVRCLLSEARRMVLSLGASGTVPPFGGTVAGLRPDRSAGPLPGSNRRRRPPGRLAGE